MIILGIDPGVASVGYGAIRFENNKFTPITFGTFHTPPDKELPERLLMIHDFITELIAKIRPDRVSVEELFFQNNVTTAIMVAQGRGTVLVAAARAGVPVYEFTPPQIKQAVVGYGKAEKKQVQQMVKMLLNLEAVPRPDDTADALAAAICLAHTSRSALPYKK